MNCCQIKKEIEQKECLIKKTKLNIANLESCLKKENLFLNYLNQELELLNSLFKDICGNPIKNN